MKVKWLCAAFISVLVITTFGVTIPANAKLHAVVEDSTTLVVLDSDSTEMYRRTFEFLIRITPRTIHLCETDIGPTIITFGYLPRDTAMVNPLPRASTCYGGRRHLIAVNPDGHESLSSDIRWRDVGCDGITLLDKRTLFILHADGGEVTKVDLITGEPTTIPISDWGRFAGCDEEGPIGLIQSFPGNRAAIVRAVSDRSEVLLLSAEGNILWRHDDKGIQRHMLIIDPQDSLIITVIITWGSSLDGVHYSYQQECQAIAESGEIAWTVPLGEVVVTDIACRKGEIVVTTVPHYSAMEEDVPSYKCVRIDPKTGSIRGQP